PRPPDALAGYAVCVRVPLTFTAGIAACCAAVLAIAGCGAGQITQTDHQIAAVDGTFGDAGTSIALRNVLIPYPHNPAGTYPSGSSVPVSLAIINQGSTPDELIGVTSPVANQVLVMGTTQLPPGTTVLGTIGTAASTDQPASPLVVGDLRVLL